MLQRFRLLVQPLQTVCHKSAPRRPAMKPEAATTPVTTARFFGPWLMSSSPSATSNDDQQ